MRELMDRYVALLLDGNRRVNVTAARDEAAVWEHIEDSLTLAPYVRTPHVDVGSGGGFPAIPLAIACGFEGTLVESLAKKARFLEEMIAELGLPLTVVCARAEEVGQDARYRERFASATARAVASAPTVLELTLPLLRIGGTAILQRGTLEERERIAVSDAAFTLGGNLDEELLLPGSEERRLLFVTKRTATAPRFPRRAGVPHKRPLCLD